MKLISTNVKQAEFVATVGSIFPNVTSDAGLRALYDYLVDAEKEIDNGFTFDTVSLAEAVYEYRDGDVPPTENGDIIIPVPGESRSLVLKFWELLGL